MVHVLLLSVHALLYYLIAPLDLYHLTGDQEKEFTLRQESSAMANEIQSGERREI